MEHSAIAARVNGTQHSLHAWFCEAVDAACAARRLPTAKRRKLTRDRSTAAAVVQFADPPVAPAADPPSVPVVTSVAQAADPPVTPPAPVATSVAPAADPLSPHHVHKDRRLPRPLANRTGGAQAVARLRPALLRVSPCRQRVLELIIRTSPLLESLTKSRPLARQITQDALLFAARPVVAELSLSPVWKAATVEPPDKNACCRYRFQTPAWSSACVVETISHGLSPVARLRVHADQPRVQYSCK